VVGETTGTALSVRCFFVGIFVFELEIGEAAGTMGVEAFFVALTLDDVDDSFLVVAIVFGDTFDDGATEVEVVADNGLEETISTDFETFPVALVLPGERTALSEDEDGADVELFTFCVTRISITTDALFWLDRLVVFGFGGARSLAEELLDADMLTRSPII
jgi:hypothetical protein